MHFKFYREVCENLKNESAQVSCRNQGTIEKAEIRFVIMKSQAGVFDAQIACAASA